MQKRCLCLFSLLLVALPVPAADKAHTLAADLWRAFDENEAAADKMYTNKPVEVMIREPKVSKVADGVYTVGAVTVTSASFTPEQVAKLSPQEKKWCTDGFPPNLICVLSKEASKKAGDLPPSAALVIKGTCTGRKADKDVYKGYTVGMKDCEIVRIIERVKN